jgi:ATP-dependent Clp protease ATP-binding subunit ClpC
MLLQVMEEGQLTDARGRRVDFRNAIIVMTSNVGADTIKRGSQLGFSVPLGREVTEKESYEDMKKSVLDQLRRAFRPEFLNRVDASIVFRSLTRDEIKQIVELELHKVSDRLIEHAVTLDITEAARDWLAEHGYDPDYGARPLRRLIQNEIEDALSDGILSGRFSIGSMVTITTNEAGELVFENADEPHAELAETAASTPTAEG